MAHTQYGIGVTKNRFELFDDEEEDPLEVLKVKEQEKEARKKTKLSEKENKIKEPPKGKPALPRKPIKDTQNLKGQDPFKAKEDQSKNRFQHKIDRQDRRFNPDHRFNQEHRLNQDHRYNTENREDRITRRNRDDRTNDVHRDDRFERREYRDRGEGRGFLSGDADVRGRGRGSFNRGGNMGRGGRGRAQRPGFFDNRGKREFERQSGSDKTGVKPVDKREGSGAHNWGTHRDDLVDLQNNHRQSAEDPPNWNSDKPDESLTESNSAGQTEESDTIIPGTEDEPRELTLDEWKAMRGPRQKPVYNLRKAGEGEDLTQWKKMYALQKKKEGDEEEEDDDEEYESCEYPQRVGRQKHILDIDIHFKDARVRGRGGRGGRGGPRLNARAVVPPIPSPEKAISDDEQKRAKDAPKVDDENDFPSLG